MDVGRAFSYITEDKDWVSKLLIIGVLTFIPIIGTAALIGWMIELIRNMRAGDPQPMPRWVDFGTKFSEGIVVFIAYLVYSIPMFVFACCIFGFAGVAGSGDSDAISGLVGIMMCCTLPLLLVYSLLIFPMLGLGTIRYSQSGQSGDLYRFSELWATLRENANLTVQWVVLSFVISFILGLIGGFIPCCGGFVAAALTFPIQGHMLGQYALLLSGEKPKRKNEGTI